MRSVPAFPHPNGPLDNDGGEPGKLIGDPNDARRFQEIQTAARAVVAGPLHLGQPPSPRQFAVLRMTSLATLRALGRAQLQVVAAGMVMARVRANDIDAAGDLIEALEHGVAGDFDPTLPPAVLLPFECAVAEQMIAAGRPHTATGRSGQACELANEAGDPRWVRRTLGLNAAAHALSGSLTQAEELLDQLARLEATQGWESDFPDYMGSVAGLIIAFMKLDAERIRDLLSKMQDPAPHRRKPRALMLLMAALEKHSLGDADRALQLATKITAGPESASGADLVVIAALALQGAILTARGDAFRAVTLLDGVPSPEGHFLCLPTNRASAFLALGQYNNVLEATSECMKMRSTHSVRTLPAVLLRRSIAHLRLGQEDAALHDASDALLTSATLYPSSSLYLIPRADLETLRDFVSVRRPDLKPEVLWVEQGMATVREAQSPPTPLPEMTRREKVVALHLRSSLSYPSIAEILQVAPSTLKTQALSIYRKLGVGSREEAVFILEQLGFFDQ